MGRDNTYIISGKMVFKGNPFIYKIVLFVSSSLITRRSKAVIIYSVHVYREICTDWVGPCSSRPVESGTEARGF